TCALVPQQLTLDGTDAETSTGTITLTGNLLPRIKTRNLPGGLVGPALLCMLAFLMIAALAMAKRRRLQLGFGAAALACILLAGCGGGTKGTPNGTYQMQITGTATPGGQTHSAVITLTVD